MTVIYSVDYIVTGKDTGKDTKAPNRNGGTGTEVNPSLRSLDGEEQTCAVIC